MDVVSLKLTFLHDKEYQVYEKKVRIAKTRTRTSLLMTKAATKTIITLYTGYFEFASIVDQLSLFFCETSGGDVPAKKENGGNNSNGLEHLQE